MFRKHLLMDEAGDGGGAGGSGGGAGGTGGEGGAGGGGSPGAVQISSLIPDSFKSSPWASNIKDVNDLFTQFDGLQKKLGSQTGIPGEGANDKDWEAFTGKLRAKSLDDYKLPDTDFGGTKRTPEWNKKLAGIYSEAGLHPRQAAAVQQRLDALQLEIIKDSQNKVQEFSQQFDSLADKHFGNAQEKEKALKQVSALAAEYGPKDLLQHLQTMDNQSMVMMAAIVNSIAKKYIPEDKLPQGGGAVTDTEEGLQKQMRDLMNSPDYQRPGKRQDELQSQITEIAKKIALIRKK